MVERLKSGTAYRLLALHCRPLLWGNRLHAHLHAVALTNLTSQQCNTPTKSPRLASHKLGTHQRLYFPLARRLSRSCHDQIAHQRHGVNGLFAGERHPNPRGEIMVFSEGFRFVLLHLTSYTARANSSVYHRSSFIHVTLCSRYHHDDPLHRRPLMVMGDNVWRRLRSWGNVAMVSLFLGHSHSDTQREPDSPLPLSKFSPTRRTAPPCWSRHCHFYRMDTPMNTASKAFALSLAFHSLMALFALLILNAFHPPVLSLALPLKHVQLVSLSQASKILTPPSTPIAPTKTAKAIPNTPTKELPLMPQKVSPAPQQVQATQPTVPLSPSPVLPITLSKPTLAAVAIPVQSPMRGEPKTNISAEKQSFFAHLRTKIQQNLRYPSTARRRGMEGEVSVQFVLENSGAIRDITIREGDGIFHESARLAVASASGVKIPEVLSDTFPADVKLTLEFRLD